MDWDQYRAAGTQGQRLKWGQIPHFWSPPVTKYRILSFLSEKSPEIMSPYLPDYDHVNEALQQVQAEPDAAEFHGQLCGMLCTSESIQLDDWLNISLSSKGSADLSPSNQTLFQELLLISGTGLISEDFSFQLLLPDDETGLALRVEALSHWCQGFLMGVSAGGVTDTKALPDDLPEILEDFLGISRAESYELVDEEEDETAYAELVEYVRVSAQLFYEELRDSQADIPPDGPLLH